METQQAKIFSKRVTFTLIFIAIGIIVAIIRPFDGLDSVGHVMLGTMIAGLSAWIFSPSGGSLTIGAIIIIAGGLLAGLPINELTVGFSGSSLWLFIPAMFIGASLRLTGLGRRIVYWLFKRLNLNYAKILGGWFVVGILFALMTPIATVRCLMLTPIAVSVADACCLEKGSRGRSIIVIACWTMSIFPSLAWKNGSLFGPVFTNFLPEGPMRDMATQEAWFIVMAPWLLFSIVFIIALYFILKPKEKLNISKETVCKMYDDLGPITKKEKGCLFAISFMFICLIIQMFLPITTNQILLITFALLLLLGVLSAKDISSANWDVVMFFGIMLSFTNIFSVSGLTAWLTPFLSGVMQAIAITPLFFILALFGICIILRFVDVAQAWILAPILSLATPVLFYEHGFHPLVSTYVFVTASCLFFFRYHQAWIVQVESVCGDSGWNPKHLKSASILFVCLAALMLVFNRYYWGLVGIL